MKPSIAIINGQLGAKFILQIYTCRLFCSKWLEYGKTPHSRRNSTYFVADKNGCGVDSLSGSLIILSTLVVTKINGHRDERSQNRTN